MPLFNISMCTVYGAPVTSPQCDIETWATSNSKFIYAATAPINYRHLASQYTPLNKPVIQGITQIYNDSFDPYFVQRDTYFKRDCRITDLCRFTLMQWLICMRAPN